MSRRLQDLFWDIDLSGTEQVVAQRLAWHANDADGRCWPGIRTLADKTGLSERTVQTATKALELAGHITREERMGHGMIYTVHPRSSCTPQGSADCEVAQEGKSEAETPAAIAPPSPAAAVEEPPQEMHPRSSCTPAAAAPTPAAAAPKQVNNREYINGESAGDAREARITGQKGRRIEADWQPTLPLPEKLQRVVDGWPPGKFDDVRDEFRDHWLAAAGQIASKLDWNRAFHNRIRAVIDRDKDRGTRHGRTDRQPGQRYRDPLLERDAREGHPGVG